VAGVFTRRAIFGGILRLHERQDDGGVTDGKDHRVGDERELRVRVYAGDAIAMGPGKADLLAAIAATGSISGAGRALGMSYKRAWDLVATMNENFDPPLVATNAGGSGGGGAALTAAGEAVLLEFRAMQQKAQLAIAADLRKFRKHLKSR